MSDATAAVLFLGGLALITGFGFMGLIFKLDDILKELRKR